MDEYARAEERFRAVIRGSPEERARLVAETEASDPSVGKLLRRMVDADARVPAWLDATGLGQSSSFPARKIEAAGSPPIIPGFEITAKIAEGGMGVVYRALQHSPRREVAIKLIRPELVSRNESSISLFERESRTLARLHHPGIATVHAVLASNGHPPCFVMELVEGLDLRSYVEAHRLTVRRCVEIIARLAEAIGHAHSLGVVHRDLKPSNVLVTGHAHPKIVDFGIAKLLDSTIADEGGTITAAGVIGTLPYISPEQIGVEAHRVSARADVHALGVMLFEAVTGRLPYDGVRGEPVAFAVRAMATGEPLRLRRAMPRGDGSVRGSHSWRDLESIIARSIARSADARYADGSELAADLRRWLDGTAVQARPETALGRAGRFASRNRGLVISVCAAAMALISGTVLSVTLGVSEHRARVEAESSAITSASVERFLRDTFELIDPERAQGQDTTLLRQMLEQAEARLDAELADQVDARARLHGVFGWVYERLGIVSRAVEHLERADALYAESGDAQSESAFQNAVRLQAALRSANRMDEARAIAARALEIGERLYDRHDEKMIEARAQAARNRDLAGDTTGAAPELSSAAEDARKFLDAGNRVRIEAEVFYAHALMRLSRHAEAEAVLTEAVSAAEAAVGPDDPGVHVAVGYLAGVYLETGRPEEARPLLERSLAYRESVYGSSHGRTLATKGNLGAVYLRIGEFTKAEELAREVLDARLSALGAEHPLVAVARSQVGQALMRQKRFDEALPEFESALRIALASAPEDVPMVTDRGIDLGICLVSMGRVAEGVLRLQNTYGEHVAARGAAHPMSRHIAREVARALEYGGRGDEAGAWLWAATEGREPKHAPGGA